MPRLDWQSLVDSMPDTGKLVHLAFRMDSVNEEAYRAELVKTRRREYEATLTELASSANCDQQGRLGEGDILSSLNEMSQTDAESIVNTYNYEMAVAVIAIREETPTANRNTYVKRLRDWEENRAKWKEPQIATNTTLSARQQAQRDFNKFNPGVEPTVILLGPDPAAEEVCQGVLDMGRIPLSQANTIDMPAHINCAHIFGDLETPQLNIDECGELWLGT